METTAATFLTVPLNKLAVSPRNVRKTEADSIDDLLSSIPVHGLLQSLVVEPGEKKGHYLVVAGGRRLRALHVLAKEKALPKGYEVPCKLAEGDYENLSLAENCVRISMHPADQYEAFVAQIETGKRIEDIANAFNVSETIVRKRLKLGRVASEILDAYRAGEIEYNEVAAYTLTDDQDRQRAVFAQNPQARSHTIKHALTEGNVAATDKRAKFVTVEAYEAAGGAIVRDLFAEGAKGFFLADAALLDRLFNEKIEALKAEVTAEGWQECVYEPEGYYRLSDAYKGRIYPKAKELSEAENAELDALCEQLDELAGAFEADPDNTELEAEYDALNARIDAFKGEAYDADEMSQASAAIVFDYDGKASIQRGLLKSARKAAGGGKVAPATSPDGLPAPTAKMQTELAAIRTAMIAADLADNPHVGLAATVHAMAQEYFTRYARVSAVQIRADHAKASSEIANKVMRPLAALDDKLLNKREAAPAHPHLWWTYFLAMTDADLLGHLALFNALSLKSFGQFVERSAKIHGDELADALGTKPERWATLSDLDFLARSSKAVILAAVEKTKGKDRAVNIAGLKKAALVERATAELSGFTTAEERAAYAERAERETAIDDIDDDAAFDDDDEQDEE